RELLADARRIEDVERHLAAAELQVALALGLDLESKRAGVERLGPRDVLREHRDEVRPFDFHARLLIRLVALVERQRVPVGIREVRHVADAGVERLAVEDDTLSLEL